MNNISTRVAALAPHILGIMRFITGALFVTHGAQKVFGAFGGIPPGSPAWIVNIGGWMEVIGGILIAIGLFTRIAAFLCSGEMAVAYFYGHIYMNPVKSFWPNVNGGEMAVLFCWIFLYIAAAGPGSFAVDNLLWRRKD
jgi:putative oxidoreductase